MEAGKYRHRITIEQIVAIVDPDYGPQPGDWTAVVTRIAAEIQDVLPSRSERVTQGMQVATRPTRIRFRYMRGITSAMRVIIHDETDRVLQIVGGPAVLGNREDIELICEEYSVP